MPPLLTMLKQGMEVRSGPEATKGELGTIVVNAGNKALGATSSILESCVGLAHQLRGFRRVDSTVLFNDITSIL